MDGGEKKMRTLVKLHESLRSALNYRIQNGTMTVSLMARSTGLSVSHVSNFLHGRKKLSLSAMDKVIELQGLIVELAPCRRQP
jgi:antitoxin component HigA of HigAB toxin-antitoxin module